jgi:hypothetical protein
MLESASRPFVRVKVVTWSGQQFVEEAVLYRVNNLFCREEIIRSYGCIILIAAICYVCIRMVL